MTTKLFDEALRIWTRSNESRKSHVLPPPRSSRPEQDLPGSSLTMSSTENEPSLSGSTALPTVFWPPLIVALIARMMLPALLTSSRGIGPLRIVTLAFQSTFLSPVGLVTTT